MPSFALLQPSQSQGLFLCKIGGGTQSLLSPDPGLTWGTELPAPAVVWMQEVKEKEEYRMTVSFIA